MTYTTDKPNIIFYIIGVIALIWNSLGVHGYIQQVYMTEGFKAQYSAEQLEIISNLPAWVTAAFAIAVCSSTLGCLVMLARKKISVQLFQIGLIAVIAQTFFNVFLNEGKQFYGGFEYAMLIMIPLISIYLVWYSKAISVKGWLT